ncbi:hypothetical protein IKG38_01605 [Candidatus Saccharibacteria bacterium]|nr:hypothetical protein [Candidatus Saccharibacteria bacterium]
MNKIKTMLRRLRYKMRHDFFTVENMVLIFAIALCLVWTYQSVAAMSRNWELSERLNKEKRELELAKIEVEAAELENEYYKTDEYQELLARKFLDKELAGEHMVVLPENSEEAKNKFSEVIIEEKETEKTNFDKWMMFLFPNF